MSDRTEEVTRLIVGLLDEPNDQSVRRLIELFGPELITAKAHEALTLFQEAQAQGPDAYKEKDTAVSTHKGKPRALGGVFFSLMKKVSLSWQVRIATQPASEHEEEPQKQSAAESPGSNGKKSGGTSPQATVTEQKVAAETASAPLPPVHAATSAAEKEPATKATPPVSGATKPGRIKVTVVGQPRGNPTRPAKLAGVVQLLFTVEMSQALPKGLPNLGRNTVAVLCTEKQYNKVKDSLTPESRMIVEGEGAALADSNGKPYLCVICLNMTTPELQQAGRAKQQG